MLPAPFPWSVDGSLFLIYSVYHMVSAFFHLRQAVCMVCRVEPSSHHCGSHLSYCFYHSSCFFSSFKVGHHPLLCHCLTWLVELRLLFPMFCLSTSFSVIAIGIWVVVQEAVINGNHGTFSFLMLAIYILNNFGIGTGTSTGSGIALTTHCCTWCCSWSWWSPSYIGISSHLGTNWVLPTWCVHPWSTHLGKCLLQNLDRWLQLFQLFLGLRIDTASHICMESFWESLTCHHCWCWCWCQCLTECCQDRPLFCDEVFIVLFVSFPGNKCTHQMLSSPQHPP